MADIYAQSKTNDGLPRRIVKVSLDGVLNTTAPWPWECQNVAPSLFVDGSELPRPFLFFDHAYDLERNIVTSLPFTQSAGYGYDVSIKLVDPAGNYYAETTGKTRSSKNSQIEKLDRDGNRLWYYEHGPNTGVSYYGTIYILNLAVDSVGDVVVVYYVPLNHGHDNVVKLSGITGLPVWQKALMGSRYDVQIDASDNVYISGSVSSNGIVCYDGDGVEKWYSVNSTVFGDQAYGCVLTADRVYVTSTHTLNIYSCPLANAGGFVAFTAMNVGSATYDIVSDATGYLYVAGVESYTGAGWVLAKYSAGGVQQWVLQDPLVSDVGWSHKYKNLLIVTESSGVAPIPLQDRVCNHLLRNVTWTKPVLLYASLCSSFSPLVELSHRVRLPVGTGYWSGTGSTRENLHPVSFPPITTGTVIGIALFLDRFDSTPVAVRSFLTPIVFDVGSSPPYFLAQALSFRAV